MTLPGSLTAPADVFYVVQSTGTLGRREHRLASVLYETRPLAQAELVRLTAVHPGDYAIWKSTTYIEPPQWGYAVIRADGAVVPPGAGLDNPPRSECAGWSIERVRAVRAWSGGFQT